VLVEIGAPLAEPVEDIQGESAVVGAPLDQGWLNQGWGVPPAEIDPGGKLICQKFAKEAARADACKEVALAPDRV